MPVPFPTRHQTSLAWVILALLLGAGGLARAERPPLPLHLPVDCVPGANCFIQNHLDHDPGPLAVDYRHGSLTYDGHKGTDFRVRTFRDMRAGVAVLAAADGVVKAIREGMPDGPASGVVDEQAIGERLAGNSVLIDHGAGWESQYGHLLAGSVAVTPGQTVRAGDRLGLIGQSGLAQFPHVHFEERYNGQPIDPFDARDPERPDVPGEVLWRPEIRPTLTYHHAGELSSGFSPVIPDATLVADPADTPFNPRERALIFWVHFFGARRGDTETIRLLDPQGRVLAEQRDQAVKHQARTIRYLGRPRHKSLTAWPAGTYTGEFILERAGFVEPLIRLSKQLTIP
ncbi:MAG: M23 family metallopeptidase [Magnetococcales bacterium]|nr:M23 family metallopeptidase [Magnetococcales bacterium]